MTTQDDGFTPADTALLDLLAYVNLRYGSPQKARDYLRLLTHIDPEDARLWRSLALAEQKSGALEEAAIAAQHAEFLAVSKGEKAVACLLRGEIERERGNTVEAERLIGQYLSLRKEQNDSITS